MANMANITVKKNDAVTDVTYTALTPSAGDRTPARWCNLASSTKANLRATVEMSSRYNGNRSARHVTLLVKYPEVVQVGGVDTVAGIGHVTIDAILPLQVSDTAIAEVVAQAANFFKASLTQEAFKLGYAPQ